MTEDEALEMADRQYAAGAQFGFQYGYEAGRHVETYYDLPHVIMEKRRLSKAAAAEFTAALLNRRGPK